MKVIIENGFAQIGDGIGFEDGIEVPDNHRYPQRYRLVDGVITDTSPSKTDEELIAESKAKQEQKIVDIETKNSANPVGGEDDSKMTKLAFMELFHDDELAAVYAAAKTNTLVEVWLAKLNATTGDVILTDSRVQRGIDGLVAGGLLTAERGARVKAGLAPL